jgi:hypothetical protein
MTIETNKKAILDEIFLVYWKWDTTPDYDNPPANSPESFVLELFETMKDKALSNYPFRCARKYARQEGSEIESDDTNRKYKYKSTLPTDFMYATGFWSDEKRTNGIQNDVDIIGRVARSNVKDFTMEYIASGLECSVLDAWVKDYIAIFIASELSDIGGCTVEAKNYLMQLSDMTKISAGNKDYEMAHHDEISSSIHQFEWF